MHPVADPDVLAAADFAAAAVAPGDVILVVQRRVGDDDTAHRYRRQSRHRAERAGTADLDVDRLEPRPGQFGREFMRDGPARRGRAEPQPLLQVEPVDLVDHTVDVIAQRRALFLDLAVEGNQLCRGVAAAGEPIGLNPQPRQPFDGARLRFGQRVREHAPAVGEKGQRPVAGDLGVELTQRAGGGIARIGKGLAAAFDLALVERLEIGVAHVHLAAHLEHLGRAGEHLGDGVDGAGIDGDILARLAIASGGGSDQRAVFIAQREREAVDLGFGGIGQLGIGGPVQIAADAGVEFQHVGIVEGIAEAHHPHLVADLGKAFGRGGTDLIRGAVGPFQFRESRLDLGVAAFERIVIGVGDLRRIGAVIGQIGRSQRLGQRREFLACLIFGQFGNCNLARHLTPRKSSQVIGRGRHRVQSVCAVSGQAPMARRSPPSSSLGLGSRST